MARAFRAKRQGGDVEGFLARIRGGNLASVYLIHGSEKFLRDVCVRAVREAVLEEGAGAFNHDKFDWETARAGAVAAAAETLPFMAPRRLVEVRGFDKVNEGEAGIILSLLKIPPPQAVLLFVCDKADNRRTVFRRMGEVGLALRVETPSERELPAWLTLQAKGLGISLRPDAASLLVDMVEPSMGRLRGELEKLAAYLGPDGEANEAAVRELVGRSKVEAMFKLADALAEGTTGRALALIGQLVETGTSPIMLLGVLRNQIRRWTIAKAAIRQGMAPGEMAKLLGVPPFAIDRLRRQVAKPSPVFLRGLYRKLLATDRRLKRTGSDRLAREALEVFVMEMGRAPNGFAPRRI